MIGLAIEFLLLFFAGPALFTFTRHRIHAILALWGMTAYCLYILSRDPGYDWSRIWSPSAFPKYAPEILALFALAMAIGIALLLRFAPSRFLDFPRANPRMWGAVMILYPVLSVYPQGIVYRAFFFNRYRPLFGSNVLLVLASAIAFAYVHIVFRNGLAIILTLLGGLLFAYRFIQTGSLFVSAFEHALYGCAVFTIGIGQSFYYSGVRESRSPLKTPDAVATKPGWYS
ncbi:MAG TPA: CPBP family glutamic-type intramembrane protease [Bryobacteraceae bacterium]